MPNPRCICRHFKSQHALYVDECDNCQCKKFKLDETKEYVGRHRKE